MDRIDPSMSMPSGPPGRPTAPADERSRDALRVGGRLFLPLRTSHGVVGVVGISSRDGLADPLTPEERRLLDALLDQAAVAIERVRLADERDEARLAAETERLRSALLASLSHDLKTPLASITGAVTALRQYADLYDAAARDELAGTIQDEAERLTRFVTNLLDMARLEAGGIALDRQPVDLGEVVGTALQRTAPVLAEHRVAVDLAPDLPMLDLDAVLFEQVLVNLLDNAAKYAPPGSTVTLEGRRCGDAVVLTVTDEGPGLAPEDVERVFEKFYRASKGDRRRAGTGLGLAICRGFVGGARRDDRGGQPERPVRGRCSPSPSRKRPSRRRRARRWPPNERAAHPAPRGRRRAADPALAAHQPRRPGLPGPGGRDGPGRAGPLGARGARGDAPRPGPSRSGRAGGDPPRAGLGQRTWPIIVLSSRGDERGKVEALDLGADDYVTKPFGMARARGAHPHGAAPPRPGAGGRGACSPSGDLTVDLTRRLVSVRGAEVRLSNKEWDILRLLVVHAGKVLTHRMIMQEVWGPKVDVQYLGSTCASSARSSRRIRTRPRHILTETGVGYRLRASE